jgi:GT2 family glycosyltransferase
MVPFPPISGELKAVPSPQAAQKPNPWMAYFILAGTVVFACVCAITLLRIPAGQQGSPVAFGLRLFQTIVEIGASFYAFAAIFSAIAYLLTKEEEPAQEMAAPVPPIGILYLCCDDLDRSALESLLALRYHGKVYLIIHDDSRSPAAQTEVDSMVEHVRRSSHFQVLLLRRSDKQGGKSGAVNYVLRKTGHLYPYFLLCDNDTTVVDPIAIEKALPHFQNNRVAIVQCRSVAVDSPDYCTVNRFLCRSTDVFHLFLTVCSRFGWRLFIGHNALLRTKAVLQVGGLTPGFFSDDLDLAIRLNLQGHSVVYAPHIRIGEKHPPSYDAFRRRTYKWSYGCMQMLKAHAKTVLTSPQFCLAEKVSFFYFTGFYVGQTILLLYLAVSFLIAPFYLQEASSNILVNLLVGTVIVVLVYLPTCTYFLKNKVLRTSVGSVAMCGLVYGTTDFACVAGVWDCLRGKKRRWIPTNAANQEFSRWGLLLEAAFGLLLLCIPLLLFPPMLYLPCAYIFVGKFLFGPAISLLYRDPGTVVAVSAKQETAA